MNDIIGIIGTLNPKVMLSRNYLENSKILHALHKHLRPECNNRRNNNAFANIKMYTVIF